MATSGSFKTDSADGRYLTFSWEIKEQSIANNTTTIKWSLKGGGTSGYVVCGNFKVVIDGETVYSNSERIKVYTTTTVASGTKTIAHNVDGSRSFSASAQAGIYYVAVNCKGSGSWDLTDIPRAATIVSAPNFNDEGNPAITYSNPAGNVVESLQVCIADINGSTIYVPYRDVSKTGTSYTFTLTDAERTALRKASSSSNSLTVKFYIKTVIGGVNYYSNLAKTMSIVNANPTFTYEITDISQITPSKGTLIKGHSTAYYYVSATAQKNTSIAKIEVTNDIKKVTSEGVNEAEGSFVMVQSGTFTIVVTDRRGNKTTKTATMPFVNYIKPTAVIEMGGSQIEEEEAQTEVTVKGSYYTGAFGSTNNTLSVTLALTNDTDNVFVGNFELTPTISSDNSYIATTTLIGLDYRKRYTVEAIVVDKISNIRSNIYTIKFQPVFDWSEDDFNFNVPVTITDGFVVYPLMGLINAMTKTYNFDVTTFEGDNYTVNSASASLVGNTLRCNFSVTRSAATGSGNVANEKVLTMSIAHGGKIQGMLNTSFGNGASGHTASFYTTNVSQTLETLDFDVMLGAVGGASTEFSTFFQVPVTINLEYYVQRRFKMDFSMVLESLSTQGIWCLLFIWLFYTSRQESLQREAKYQEIIATYGEQLKDIADTLDAISNKLTMVENEVHSLEEIG